MRLQSRGTERACIPAAAYRQPYAVEVRMLRTHCSRCPCRKNDLEQLTKKALMYSRRTTRRGESSHSSIDGRCDTHGAHTRLLSCHQTSPYTLATMKKCAWFLCAVVRNVHTPGRKQLLRYSNSIIRLCLLGQAALPIACSVSSVR